MNKTLVIGVIGADCHAVGNKIIDYMLTNSGFNVVNIGVLSSQEEFINAAIETDAAAILVSSLYGHAEIDCRGLREKCDEAGLNGIPLYIGGNLSVGKMDFREVENKFRTLGFNRVYPPGCSLEHAIIDIKKDLGHLIEKVM